MIGRARAVLIDPAGEPTPRARQVLATASLPTAAAAAVLGLPPQTVRVYRSQLRRAGLLVARERGTAEGDALLSVHVSGPVAAELREQGRLRFSPSRTESAASVLGLLAAIIHKDNLYNAILGDPPRGPR